MPPAPMRSTSVYWPRRLRPTNGSASYGLRASTAVLYDAHAQSWQSNRSKTGGPSMRTLLLMLLPLAGLGCGGKSYLTYQGLPPAPSPSGKVAIEVRDVR